MATKSEGLKSTAETALDPELPICDAHHHLWDFPGDRYLLEEFLKDIKRGGHRIVQTVYIERELMYRKEGPEVMRPVGETEFLDGLAARSASGPARVAAAIVGFADFSLGDGVAPVLEAHIAASAGRFRGIRSISIWHASPQIVRLRIVPKGLLLDPKFRKGFAYLRKYNLCFDAWMYHTQLAELADLARAFPDTPIVLNHMGGPIHIGPYAGKRDEVLQDWRQGMTALAACPNVLVKLGGVGMPLFGFGWDKRPVKPDSTEVAGAMAPYFSLCIERFGSDRCMFESNFPPDKKAYSYNVVWNAFKRLARGFSPGDKTALFLGTAQRAYRLPSTP